jgi:hypothetical protein
MGNHMEMKKKNEKVSVAEDERGEKKATSSIKEMHISQRHF